MTFRSFLARHTLRRAVLAATAAHQPSIVQGLLSCHGHSALASALSSCSPDVLARALSLLSQEDSSTVIAQLPVEARDRLLSAFEPSHVQGCAQRQRERRALQGLLAWSAH